ncbi:MAG: hypothetical protein WBA51_15575 [Erythrobacter sp.]
MRDFTSSQRFISLTHDPSDDARPHLVDTDTIPTPKSNDATAQTSTPCKDEIWVELLREGLTFDLGGLAQGAPSAFPAIEHRFDLESVPTTFTYEALRLVPGQHLAGGERSMPVVKGLMAVARDLTHHFEDLEAVVWPPSQSAIGRRYFESTSTAWLEGGAFPGLGLTAFRETVDGALQSVGLEFWIGQELRIEQPVSSDKVAAIRLGVRLINQLIIVGGLDESERIVAPDGSRLVMRPSRNGKFIRVWRD